MSHFVAPQLARRSIQLTRQNIDARASIPLLQRGLGELHILDSTSYAHRSHTSIKNERKSRHFIALLIPAYNEKLVLEHTIRSAVTAGLPRQHIYVVDDCSDDMTSAIARRLVGSLNVVRVTRSGKGIAVQKATSGMLLSKRYEWIHIADADGEFDEHYFTELKINLDKRHAAATGYVASLPGGVISKYRTFEYAIGMDIIRRFQSLAGVITIVPGPTSIFRSDVFEKLTFEPDVLCEDFDITLQIHRLKLGTIQFIPSAIAHTQDPSTFRDYLKQITRWNRGIMQMLFKHHIGLRLGKVDAYLSYQIMQNILFFMMYAIWVPLVTILAGSLAYLALAFLSDVILMFGFMMFAAKRSGRKDIIAAFPIIYLLRWVSLGVFIKSFVEVVILHKYRTTSGAWEKVTRRSNVAPVAA